MSTNAIKERYSCTKCDKSFTVPFSLRRHMIVHDEPAFVCQLCDRRFRTKETLTRHEPIHSGVRRHGCQICHKRFASLSDLKKHLKTHEKKVYPVTAIESQATPSYNSVNNGNTNVNAEGTADKTSQTQATLNSNAPTVVKDDQFRKQNNVTQFTLSNTTGRIVSKSSSIGNEEDSNLVGGQKQQSEALDNEPVGTTRKILILFSVVHNPNNCIPGQYPPVEPDSSDQLQIAFQQIMDELAKSGSSTVDRSNP
ncbi:unnamed protein product [Orchesella dallaii]|uniref:C2H2-type domain-containing protein n=1 Tax=Orchesella dallaii TaxID=48710 RepID=A0ABP1S2C0_9HEXA